MALPPEFLHYLHEIMVEVSDSLSDEMAAHKQELIFKAQKTHNLAGLPLAYSQAQLDAFRTRIERTIERYIDAIDVWGLELDDAVERDMLVQIGHLLAAPRHVDLPPGLKTIHNSSVIQSSYGMELDRTANAIRRKAANRLREAKMRKKRVVESAKDGLTTVAGGHPVKSSPKVQDEHMTSHTASFLNVLIASPSDVNEEREVVTKVIYDWNASHFTSTGIFLNPVRWESHAYPASGDRPQAIINKQIVQSGDILVGIFGYKLGTPTGAAQSGTIEEVEEFRAAGKYVALYFSTADVPRGADRDQLEALESYKKLRQKDTLYFEFADCQSLRDHLTRQLPNIVQDVRRHLNLQRSVSQSEPDSPPRDGVTGNARAEDEVQRRFWLADVISELEDNLDRASRPVAGDVYQPPSNRAWMESRNKINFPSGVLSQLKNAYNQVDTWSAIVGSGLSPHIGSMPLNLIVSDLRMSLPSLIDQLRMLHGQNHLATVKASEQDPIKSSDWERMADRLSTPCRFIRADSQWTSTTMREVWTIAGGDTGMCRALLQQAGAMLLKSPKVRSQLSDEILSEENNLHRWLFFLKQCGFHEVKFPGYEELPDGTKITHLLGGIMDLPANSAQACIQCAAIET